MDHLRIMPGDLNDPQIVDMLTYHLTVAREVSPPEFAFALDLTGLQQPGISLYAAWNGDMLMAVGALRELDPAHGEIKSMHSHRAHRGQGSGRAMLDHIVAVAQARGYSRLSLETGSQEYFAPARALYERNGFSYCGPYGDYRESPCNTYMTMLLAPA